LYFSSATFLPAGPGPDRGRGRQGRLCGENFILGKYDWIRIFEALSLCQSEIKDNEMFHLTNTFGRDMYNLFIHPD
jgi:hypothetical protein